MNYSSFQLCQFYFQCLKCLLKHSKVTEMRGIELIVHVQQPCLVSETLQINITRCKYFDINASVLTDFTRLMDSRKLVNTAAVFLVALVFTYFCFTMVGLLWLRPRNNYCEFLESVGVNLQSIQQSFFKTPVYDASCCSKQVCRP